MERRASSAPAWSRRQWMSGVAAVFAAGTRLGADADAKPAGAETSQRTDPPAAQPLDISQYEPHSMLRVPETAVPRAPYEMSGACGCR